jgi:hypothetical protein
MKLASPSLLDVMYVTRHLREWDRKELFATRFDEDPDRLAMDVMGWGPLWWVAGGAVDGRDKAIAVIGAREVWPGMWSVGMFATDDFPKIGLSLTRWVKRAMIPAVVRQGIRRGECRSIEGHAVAHRWLETLGAKRTGESTNYGKGGETFFTYAWEF